MRNRVLVTTDLSESAEEAIRQGSAWAQAREGDLLVCHIARNLLGSNMLFPQVEEQEVLAQSDLDARIAGRLSERVAQLTHRSSADFQVIVDEGTPEVEIVRNADRQKADWLVVGAHDPTAGEIDVTAHVVRHAHRPVLVARPSRAGSAIVAATDFSDASLGALSVTAEQARLFGARVTLFHSIEREVEWAEAEANFGAVAGLVSDAAASARRDALERLERLRARFQLIGDSQVSSGDPATGIVEAAEAVGASLVVVGFDDRGLRRFKRRTTTTEVVRRAPCSVLVVPHPHS